jgi:uncharacterized membrane protein HdeD (DUF308 family)
MAGKRNVVVPDIISRNWGWLLGLGLILFLLGLIGLGMLIGVTYASMLFLGILLIIAGVIQIGDVFKSRQWEGTIWHAGIAVLYLIAGSLVIYDPFLASSIITVILASLLVIIGVVRLSMAFALRHTRGWGWLLLGGLVSLGLGLILLFQWPWSGFWFIGLFISIELLMAGWTYIFLAFALRNPK